jgi:hypothetical protein
MDRWGERPIRARGAKPLGKSAERKKHTHKATPMDRWGERPIRARGAKPLGKSAERKIGKSAERKIGKSAERKIGKSAERKKLVDLSGVEPLTSTLPV